MARKNDRVPLTWDEAPDIVGVNELMRILNLGEIKVRNIFKQKDFPKIEGVGEAPRVDKEAAQLYFKGIKVKTNQKAAMEYLILQELKKLNEEIQEIKSLNVMESVTK